MWWYFLWIHVEYLHILRSVHIHINIITFFLYSSGKKKKIIHLVVQFFKLLKNSYFFLSSHYSPEFFQISVDSFDLKLRKTKSMTFNFCHNCIKLNRFHIKNTPSCMLSYCLLVSKDYLHKNHEQVSFS